MGKWDFWDWSLAGLSVFGVALGLIVFFLYALPQEPLVIPEVQSSLEVGTLGNFEPNTAQIQRWGHQLILVIRSGSGEVTALQGTSPTDGCVLQWDDHVGQVSSPCSYQVFNSYGHALAGLSDQSLRRYPVLIRDSIISIGSGS